MTQKRFAVVFLALFWVLAARAAWPQQSAAVAPRLSQESPECAITQNGRADCLVRDQSGRFVWQFHDGRRWSRPQPLPGEFAGPASCVVRGPLGLNCFAIRRDGTLWHLAMNGGRWRQWRPLGGRLALGRPSCVAPSRNQIVCHARSLSGTLAIKSWLGDTVWQEWREAGGALSSDPSCLRLTSDRIACFWRRPDGRLSGLFPAETGPGSAVLTLPRLFGAPECASLGGDTLTCLSRDQGEWRGDAVLGGVGADGFRTGVAGLASDPVCASRAGRAICAFVAPDGGLASVGANARGWSPPESAGLPGVAAAGPCVVFDAFRVACFAVTASGELKAAFREKRGAPLTDTVAAVPEIIEKPVFPAAPAAAAALAPPATPPSAIVAPISTVSVREPLGSWRVFEPRTGLHCEIKLFDAPAQPYRSLTRDADCSGMQSLRGVDRWSQSEGAIFLRDRRGRVYFRFVEAGPTALRARWRRRDFVMMARDLRAFAADPRPAAQATEPPAAASPGLAGVWRVRGPGRQSCTIQLSIDAASAATRAAPQGCQGRLAQADGWSFRRGALVLERGGAPLARFVEGRGVTWFGRFEGGRQNLRMVKQ
jgi:hypothetical protein